MRYLALLALLPLASSADGFVCYTSQRDLAVRVYESESTATVMILSDPRQDVGHQLIARFGQVEGAASEDAASFLAQPSREPEPMSHGNSVAGVPLREVAALRLVVDFAWGRPRLSGEYVPGKLLLTDIRNENRELSVDCYLHVTR
ncbi:MAG: hypothetical protein HUU37_04975 [Bdellovibrionales bacterium]|nr:hypothetical protein [Bdellovibrionales bacterium]